LWQAEGLDVILTPYRCISTGDGVGMIQVVPDSITVAKIQKVTPVNSMAIWRYASANNSYSLGGLRRYRGLDEDATYELVAR